MSWVQATEELQRRGFRQSVVEDGREEWDHANGDRAILTEDAESDWQFAVFPADVVHAGPAKGK